MEISKEVILFSMKHAFKVAIVYDKATTWGGAERVLICLAKIFPGAVLFTSTRKVELEWTHLFSAVVVSFIDRLPFAREKPHLYELLMPIAFEKFDLRGFDLVISISSYSAHHIIVPGHIPHIHYYLTPSRYLWADPGYHNYRGFGVLNRLVHIIKSLFFPILRMRDQLDSRRADMILSISTLVQKRVKKFYQRDSVVLYPPLNDHFFCPGKEVTRKYFLYVGRLTGYKNIHAVVEAFRDSQYTLLVVGSGEDTQLSTTVPKNIQFIGTVDDSRLRDLYRGAYATIMPQLEDFGLVAAESLACGTPVIVHKKSGISEILQSGVQAIMIDSCTSEEIRQALPRIITLLQKKTIKNDCVRSVSVLSEDFFQKHFLALIEQLRDLK